MSFFTVTHTYSVFWIITTDSCDAWFPGHHKHPQAPKAAFVHTWQERTTVEPSSSREKEIHSVSSSSSAGPKYFCLAQVNCFFFFFPFYFRAPSCTAPCSCQNKKEKRPLFFSSSYPSLSSLPFFSLFLLSHLFYPPLASAVFVPMTFRYLTQRVSWHSYYLSSNNIYLYLWPWTEVLIHLGF